MESVAITENECPRSDAAWWCPRCDRFYALGEVSWKGLANPGSLAYCPDREVEPGGTGPAPIPISTRSRPSETRRRSSGSPCAPGSAAVAGASPRTRQRRTWDDRTVTLEATQ